MPFLAEVTKGLLQSATVQLFFYIKSVFFYLSLSPPLLLHPTLSLTYNHNSRLDTLAIEDGSTVVSCPRYLT